LEARYKVISAAAKYENTPYRYGGVTSSGLDCSGFIFLSFKDALGVSLPRSTSGIYSWTERISREQAQPGDLLFFKTDTTGRISHVALYLGDGRFIHAASTGQRTGVIYSSLDEQYWARAFAGAGRAFPASTSGFRPVIAGDTGRSDGMVAETRESAIPGSGRSGLPSGTSSGSGRLLVGAAFAPTWIGFLKGDDLFRGFASQLRLTAETYSFGPKMVFGLEIRPEYDGALGVFRLPITLSWGPSDKFMIFAGPVLSFGDPSISTEDGSRRYSGGTSWLGAAGITATPFSMSTASGEFAPYFEAAWQYYFSENDSRNLSADISAGFRFSTGIRWTIQVR
jgi:probable lipoprotein NlpC